MNCVKNCSSINARIGLEKRIFDYKAFAPQLMVEDVDSENLDPDDQAESWSDQSEHISHDIEEFNKNIFYPDHGLNPQVDPSLIKISDFSRNDAEKE